MTPEADRGAPRPDNPGRVRKGSTEPNRTSDNPEPDDLAEILRQFCEAYPEDIFPTPPPEKQARDAAAAHVLRTVAVPWFAKAADRIEALEADVELFAAAKDDAVERLVGQVDSLKGLVGALEGLLATAEVKRDEALTELSRIHAVMAEVDAEVDPLDQELADIHAEAADLRAERDAETALAAEAKAEIHANARTFAALIAEQRAKAAEVVDAAENLLHSLGARLAYEVSQDRLVEQAADTLTERVTAWRRTKNESEHP